MLKEALIIFVKNPVLGTVKTRIAASVGDERALDIYKRMLGITRETALNVKTDRFVYYSPEIVDEDLWSNGSFQKRQQSKGDLGSKMATAFVETLTLYERSVIIGSDCPDLKALDIENAFEALHSKDVVLGPSKDGGYYLIGLNKPQAPLFHGIPWSTSNVLRKTIEICESMQLRYGLLRELSDIDHIEDWQQFEARTNGSQ